MRGLTNRCGIRRQAANGLPDRTGRNQQLARANIVTWPDRRVGHVVDTTAKAPCRGRAAKKSLGTETGAAAVTSACSTARLKSDTPPLACRGVRVAGGSPGVMPAPAFLRWTPHATHTPLPN